MLKLLLVDDEKMIHFVYREELEKAFPGCEMRSVYSGQEALKALGEYEPDVVLLDIRMPGMNGVEVLQRIKAMNPYVSVIFELPFLPTEVILQPGTPTTML